MKLIDDLNLSDGKVIKAGKECPESELGRLLRHNWDKLDLEYKGGWPVLSEEIQKKYNLHYPPNVVKTKQKIVGIKYSQDNLTTKLNELGSKGFKEWAEKTFGENKIDRRHLSKKIIVEILRLQEERRR